MLIYSFCFFFKQGGLTFVLAKGFIKILLRQNQYIRQTHRKILNFDNKSETE